MLDKLLPGWTIKKADGDEVLVVAPNGNGSHVQNKGSLVNRVLYQLANAIIDATAPKEKPAKPSGHRNCTFNFARHEDGAVSTIGILSFSTEIEDDDTAWDAMLEAITQWVKTTDAGRKLWSYSCQDLNVGDLASSDAFKDADLLALLAERGLRYESVVCSDAVACHDYDFVLADAGQIPDEEEIETGPQA